MFYVCWWIQLKNELYCTLIYIYSRVVMFFTAKKAENKVLAASCVTDKV